MFRIQSPSPMAFVERRLTPRRASAPVPCVTAARGRCAIIAAIHPGYRVTFTKTSEQR